MLTAVWGWLWRRSIRRQLVIGVALVHALLMTVFVYDLVERQRTFLLERAEQRAQFQAGLLATSGLQEVITNDVAGLTELVEAVSSDASSVIVTDARGRVLAAVDRAKVGHYLEDAGSLSVLTGPSRARILDRTPRVIVAVAPITTHGRTIGWVWVSRDLAPDRAHLRYVTGAGVGYTLAAIVAGTLFALLLSRTLIGQLRLLLSGTERFARGDSDQPIPVVTENELGSLTRTFNATMSTLVAQKRELDTLLTKERDARRAAEEATAEVHQLNEQLEARVDARTAELVGLNKELETFSYSVSHDLRSPLRAIEGFSAILEEDHADKLGPSGIDSLRRIRAASSRMGELIDDLLSLARVSRDELTRAPVDLSAMALSVAEGFRRSSPSRVVALEVQKHLAVEGDARLLRIVLENLLGNAWKFTSKVELARVEVGAITAGGTTTFFVRDNGAGFDMARSEKLFGAFQRMHGRDDFEGTGIGLATVQRILARHGGRIWAEAAPGKGAAFFLSFRADPR